MCSCIDEVRKKLKEQTKDDIGILKNVSYMFSGGEILGTSFLYNARKKDGTKSKKLTTETILFVYCPFCGKKYKE